MVELFPVDQLVVDLMALIEVLELLAFLVDLVVRLLDSSLYFPVLEVYVVELLL